MKIMSIDASTKSTGVALFEDGKLIDYKNFVEGGVDTLSRIDAMATAIENYYLENKPKVVVMEDVLPSDVGNNLKTFNPLHYLQAEVVLRLHRRNQKVEFMNVNTWRSICGITVGRYGKREIVKAKSIALVKNKYGIEANDDICDAICLGWAYQNEEPSAF